jgi:hypothetical protein
MSFVMSSRVRARDAKHHELLKPCPPSGLLIARELTAGCLFVPEKKKKVTDFTQPRSPQIYPLLKT